MIGFYLFKFCLVGSRWDAEDLASPEKRADHSDVNCLLEFISVGERIFYGAKSVRAGSATPLQLSTLRLRQPVLWVATHPGLDPAYVVADNNVALLYVVLLRRPSSLPSSLVQ